MTKFVLFGINIIDKNKPHQQLIAYYFDNF